MVTIHFTISIAKPLRLLAVVSFTAEGSLRKPKWWDFNDDSAVSMREFVQKQKCHFWQHYSALVCFCQENFLSWVRECDWHMVCGGVSRVFVNIGRKREWKCIKESLKKKSLSGFGLFLVFCSLYRLVLYNSFSIYNVSPHFFRIKCSVERVIDVWGWLSTCFGCLLVK